MSLDVATCQAILAEVGLQSNVSTLSASDPDAGRGDVTETLPEEGDTVQPDATVQIAANPNADPYSHTDLRCDMNQGSNAGADPGNPKDGTNYATYALVGSSPYPAGVDPSQSSPAQTAIPLRWGTKGWGWRHILQKHPYTSADEQQTMLALATDPTPVRTGFLTTNQWDFHLFYQMPDGAGGEITCLRTVRVEYFRDRQMVSGGITGIRGIQNSYSGFYDGGILGH